VQKKSKHKEQSVATLKETANDSKIQKLLKTAKDPLLYKEEHNKKFPDRSTFIQHVNELIHNAKNMTLEEHVYTGVKTKDNKYIIPEEVKKQEEDLIKNGYDKVLNRKFENNFETNKLNKYIKNKNKDIFDDIHS